MVLHLGLTVGITPIRDDESWFLEMRSGRQLRLTRSTLLDRLLARLSEGGGSLSELMGDVNSLSLYFELLQLERHGVISISLMGKNGLALTLVPNGHRFVRITPPSDSFQMKLSRYLMITPGEEGLDLAVPMKNSQLIVHDERLASIICRLALPIDKTALELSLPCDLQEDATSLIMLLLSAGVVGVIETDGELSCDRKAKRERWSREDLALHHRSRLGWHEEPIGATYRDACALEAAPPISSLAGQRRVKLSKMNEHESTIEFFSVVERRRSLRTPSATPINLEQVGKLLWASLRVQTNREFNGEYQGLDEGTFRPVASGGALHEIDTYLIVRRCKGLKSGLYRYDPRDHELVQVDELNTASQQLLELACQSANVNHPPDILLCFAARYGRVSWKYEGIVYSLILKHVGAIMQQLYLVSTALNLSPCALGSGDSALFAEATGLHPMSDAAVGEFMISGSDK